MKDYTLHLTGLSVYSQSRPHRDPKKERETAEDYEARTWRSRLHTDDEGNILLPAMSLKNTITNAAKYLSMPIPGKARSTFTKHIESGIIVLDSPIICDNKGTPLKVSDLPTDEELKEAADSKGSGIKKNPFVWGDWIFTPSDGKAGGGSRVYKCYPCIKQGWQTDILVTVGDDIVTKSVLETHLRVAGNFIGLGRWRVRNGGLYGRFNAEIVNVDEADLAS